jgi:3-phenylpropionate/trans-cinnamate dioxygenase ferredoxin component
MNYTQIDPDSCEFISIASQDELPNGERLFLVIDDVYLVVFNIAGDLYAIADLCSHDDGPLGEGELDGHLVACPRHGARFDVRTGEACTLPAVEAIPAYPVRLVDGHIEVGLPKE